jgi:hypothetical protein
MTRREFIQLILCSGATAALARVPLVRAVAPYVTPYVTTPPLPVFYIPFGIGGAAPRAARLAHNLYIPVVTND